jgi:hypothetical protein
MKMKYAFAMLAAAGALSGSVRAEDPSSGADLEQLRSMVKPADVDLIFNYLREAMKASAEGRAPPVPPAQLMQRAQEVQHLLKQHGEMTMDQMLQQIQQEVRKSLPAAPHPDAPHDHSLNRPEPRT